MARAARDAIARVRRRQPIERRKRMNLANPIKSIDLGGVSDRVVDHTLCVQAMDSDPAGQARFPSTGRTFLMFSKIC